MFAIIFEYKQQSGNVHTLYSVLDYIRNSKTDKN